MGEPTAPPHLGYGTIISENTSTTSATSNVMRRFGEYIYLSFAKYFTKYKKEKKNVELGIFCVSTKCTSTILDINW